MFLIRTGEGIGDPIDLPRSGTITMRSNIGVDGLWNGRFSK